MAVPVNPNAPLRIQKLTIENFRAFPDATEIVFNGKNMLIYGENGSGKSSIFHALKEFFVLRPEKPLDTHKNIFSTNTNVKVAVEFDNDTPQAEWLANQHPATIYPSNPFVVNTALRRACLDYRSLLEVNFKHGNEPINLFHITVEHLLKDYSVPTAGGSTSSIGQLWQDVLNTKPHIQNPATIEKADQACEVFNAAFRQVVPHLIPKINELMQVLGWEDVIISGISFAGLSYFQAKLKASRKFNGQTLFPIITFRNQRLPVPQTFLNEARLSALALAIYLAGRLVSVPINTAGQLKLLVLDDVLVGLDHANRIPVLDVLKKYFSDWQIVLLTHDRLWFEITRARANIEGDNWEVLELYANHEEDANYRPTLRASHRDVVEAYLQTAEQHLTANPPDYRASAVYARSAFEMWLKLQCDKHHIPIPFSFEPRKIDSNTYFNALEVWDTEKNTKPAFSGVIKILALYRDTVFNPASHSYPTTMNGMELKMAIRAMRFINEATKGNSTLKLAEHLLNKANPSQEEIVLAAAFVRSMFVRRLREFAEGKLMPFSIKPHKTSMTALWSMMADKWPPKRATWVANINLNQAILIDTWTWTFLQTVTVTQVRNALQAIQQH